MAHFAKLTDGMVTEVIVVGNDVVGEYPQSETVGQAFIASLGFDGLWLQTSYNNNFRRQYAGIGSTYNQSADEFVAPQPYASWSLDANNDWQSPTPKTNELYVWDEESLSWVDPLDSFID